MRPKYCLNSEQKIEKTQLSDLFKKAEYQNQLLTIFKIHIYPRLEIRIKCTNPLVE